MRLFFKLSLIILCIGIAHPAFTAVTIFYDYDDLNRLTSMLRFDGLRIKYTYDEVGNIESRIVDFPDTDGDGMSDGWERFNGLNPYVNDASLDNDSDGLSNLQEYGFGTDPNKADCGDQGGVCQTCPNVRIASTPPEYYGTLQEALNMAMDGDIIQSKAGVFHTSLTFNRNISITLHGGYDCDYATESSHVTTLRGQININVGHIHLKNFVLIR